MFYSGLKLLFSFVLHVCGILNLKKTSNVLNVDAFILDGHGE